MPGTMPLKKEYESSSAVLRTVLKEPKLIQNHQNEDTVDCSNISNISSDQIRTLFPVQIFQIFKKRKTVHRPNISMVKIRTHCSAVLTFEYNPLITD